MLFLRYYGGAIVYISFAAYTYMCNTTVYMYSGITSDRLLDGELLYTKIREVNLFAFAYRLFHEDFSSIGGTSHRLTRNLHETVCRQVQTN